jgi:pyruvate,orthophosphate dikinase
MTSHAAVVTRGMGKCCVAGAGECTVDENRKELRVHGKTFHQGDWLSLDGTTGRVLEGKLKTIPARPDDADLVRFMSWVDPVRRLRIRANADVPRDAKQARLFGAEGIGLCRTEHMFFAEGRIEHVRGMILAHSEEERRAALKHLLPMQRQDFIGLFKAMESLPVTIRLLDPPLHEFLPQREELLVEIQHLEDTKPRSPKLKELRVLLARVQELHEVNPMLGLRGCRLGIAFPEITEMQARAILEAAVNVKNHGGDPHLEIMIPLIGGIEEMRNQSTVVKRIAAQVFKEKGVTVDYMVGTMIELPRAALTADQIAEEAEFFSFGTNDLTQTTYGISRDDINHFLPAYLKAGIFKQDPFATLDQAGVGSLVKTAVAKGRNTRPTLKVGICGEHGGDPESVKFCHKIGLNYVSCSPFRLLTARLAAAQAALQEKQTGPDVHSGTC